MLSTMQVILRRCYSRGIYRKRRERKEVSGFPIGYGRFSLLAALINGVVLLEGSIVVIVHVIPRLF